MQSISNFTVTSTFIYVLIMLQDKSNRFCISHDDGIKWKHFPRYWPFVRGIHWSPVNSTGEFPTQRPVTRNFDVFFDRRLNKRLNKQSWGWWFETPLRPLWRHCYAMLFDGQSKRHGTEQWNLRTTHLPVWYMHLIFNVFSNTVYVFVSKDFDDKRSNLVVLIFFFLKRKYVYLFYIIRQHKSFELLKFIVEEHKNICVAPS